MKTALAARWVLMASAICLLLTGCPRTCKEKCPLDVSQGAYLLGRAESSCNPAADVQPIRIPREYVERCTSCTEGGFEDEATIQVSYPDFLPVENFGFRDSGSQEVTINIHAMCAKDRRDSKSRTEMMQARVQNAFVSPSFDKKPRYAPIRSVGGNVYLMEFINDHKDGYNYYIVKDAHGEIIDLYYGEDGDYRSAVREVTSNGRFYFSYRAKGLEPNELEGLADRVHEFTDKMNASSLPKMKKPERGYNH